MIQLYGLQAPRVEQTCQADGVVWACGQEARWAAINRVGGHWISCIERGRGAIDLEFEAVRSRERGVGAGHASS